MKEIKIVCFNNGTAQLTTGDTHFDNENLATRLEIDFSKTDYSDKPKWVDIIVNKTIGYRYELGTDEIVSMLLTSSVLVNGEMVITPIVYDGELKVKYRPNYTVGIIDQQEAIDVEPGENSDFIFQLKARMDELENTAIKDFDDLETHPTTLEGYGITDVYDKTEIGVALDLKADNTTVSDLDLATEKLVNKKTTLAESSDVDYPTVKAVKDGLDLKVDKVMKIIGIDLQNDILIDEFKTALGKATQSLDGLLSAEDKKRLDTIYASFNGTDENNVVDKISEILAIFENYPEANAIVTALSSKVDKTTTINTKALSDDIVLSGADLLVGGSTSANKDAVISTAFKTLEDVDDTKVDKVEGKALSTNDYTDEEKTKLTGIKDGAQVNVIEKIKIDGADLTPDVDKRITLPNKVASVNGKMGVVDLDGTDIQLGGGVTTTIQAEFIVIDNRIDVIESKIDVIGLDYKEYGVREVVGQSTSEFERVTRFWGEIKLGSATGLVANVAIDDADATNSFDYIPIFKRDVVDIDATDLSSNTVSNTFVKVPKFYIKEEWVTEGGTDYHYIFMSQFKHEGYHLPLPFKKQDGSERDYAYMGAYEAFLDGNNKLRSLTGQIPKVSYSRNSFRTAARALDGLGVNSKYQITDLAEYVDLVQIPFMIEFATKHSQGVYSGATSMAYSASHTAIAEGTGINAIVVSNATGANFVLGQTVSIGTSNSNDSVAKDRIVTQIDVDTPNAGETTITFDGTAVNIAIGNVIASRAWKTGMTDGVKVSGTHSLNDGKHSIVWRGLENPFGNIWKNVDGVKISNWRGYIAENPKDYNDTASVAGVYAEPYLPLGYLNANTNNYAQDLGYDANYPYAKFPISVQASSGLFFRDYYYQNSGDRTVFVGGYWGSSSLAGVFSWGLNDVLGLAHFNCGARLSYRP